MKEIINITFKTIYVTIIIGTNILVAYGSLLEILFFIDTPFKEGISIFILVIMAMINIIIFLCNNLKIDCIMIITNMILIPLFYSFKTIPSVQENFKVIMIMYIICTLIFLMKFLKKRLH